MSRAPLAMLVSLIVTTSSMLAAASECYDDVQQCRSDARDTRDSCLESCSSGDYSCRRGCRATFESASGSCTAARDRCYADRRRSTRDAPSDDTRPTSGPAYVLVAPPQYNPATGTMTPPVYQRVDSAVPLPSSTQGVSTAGNPCPNGAYAYQARPKGPRQYYPVPPNALCR
jgi:hypothetical protein